MRARIRQAQRDLDAADSYEAWQRAANTLDALTGLDAWRADDDSPCYRSERLRAEIADLARLRAEGRVDELVRFLHETLYSHLGDLGAPELYRTAFGGTKLLVSSYLDQAVATLLWLAEAPVPGVSQAQKRAMFTQAGRVFGRSALLLSGGATLGFVHLGVVKALHQADLLPKVISGASTGAMIAAGVCARTDDEIDAMFDDPGCLRGDGLRRVGLREMLRARALLDPNQLLDVLLANVGPWTFAEAHARTGRILNISVSPTRVRQKPRLLNHLTSPEVLIASAALASSALPGLFPPVVLQCRGADGVQRPYLPGERWVDGSVYGDLPKLRLSRLHNANHFIVSQTNPHVVPFAQHRGKRGLRPMMAGLATSTLRTQALQLADLARRLSGSGAMGRLSDQAHALVSQDYTGDIDLHPRFRLGLYRKVVSNPSPADLDAFIREGERTVWPRLAEIRDATRISRTFEACLARFANPDTCQ